MYYYTWNDPRFLSSLLHLIIKSLIQRVLPFCGASVLQIDLGVLCTCTRTVCNFLQWCTRTWPDDDRKESSFALLQVDTITHFVHVLSTLFWVEWHIAFDSDLDHNLYFTCIIWCDQYIDYLVIGLLVSLIFMKGADARWLKLAQHVVLCVWMVVRSLLRYSHAVKTQGSYLQWDTSCLLNCQMGPNVSGIQTTL